MWGIQRSINRREPYRYPESKARFEPLGVIVFASLMGSASLQIIAESMGNLIAGIRGSIPTLPLCGNEKVSDCVDPMVFWGILGATILIKAILYLYCVEVSRRTRNSAVVAYAEDHRNDCLTNIATAATLVLWRSSPDTLWWCDAAIAIAMSLWIVRHWIETGMGHIRLLAGIAAKPELLQRLTHAAFSHSPEIICIETIRAYGFGIGYLAEVHIVLPQQMTVRESHQIAESLQRTLEHIPEIQRAFVHIDYEVDHRPEDEHVVV